MKKIRCLSFVQCPNQKDVLAHKYRVRDLFCFDVAMLILCKRNLSECGTRKDIFFGMKHSRLKETKHLYKKNNQMNNYIPPDKVTHCLTRIEQLRVPQTSNGVLFLMFFFILLRLHFLFQEIVPPFFPKFYRVSSLNRRFFQWSPWAGPGGDVYLGCWVRAILRWSQANISYVHAECHKNAMTGWWQLKYFVIFTPLWGRFPFWLIFFRWVETTLEQWQRSNPGYVHLCTLVY